MCFSETSTCFSKTSTCLYKKVKKATILRDIMMLLKWLLFYEEIMYRQKKVCQAYRFSFYERRFFMLGTLLVFFLPYFLLIIFVLLIGNGSVGIDLILRDGKDDAAKRAVNGFGTTGNRHILKIVIENNGAVHP